MTRSMKIALAALSLPVCAVIASVIVLLLPTGSVAHAVSWGLMVWGVLFFWLLAFATIPEVMKQSTNP